MKLVTTAAVAAALIMTAGAQAGTRDALLAELAGAAKAAGAGFSGFSAERGAKLFSQTFSGGKPDISSCTTCHTDSPLSTGRTRAGKVIEPLAVSKTPDRFTDPAKVAKWFKRNCKSVMGRECTAQEKGDFLTFAIKK